MKKILQSFIFGIILLFTAVYSNAQVTVVGSTGADATYTSLTNASGAFAAINAAGSQAGNNITVNITADLLAETGANPLNASDWVTLTISPSGGAIRNVQGNVVGALIRLNGADNVIIDGLNTGGNQLNIDNSSRSLNASTIALQNDASFNTIRKCNILGADTSSFSGNIIINNPTTTGNDNNTISECNISASSNGTPFNGIYSNGSTSVITNDNLIITLNNISDYFNATVSAPAPDAGITIGANNTNVTITNNSFYQTAVRTAAANNHHYGVFVSGGGASGLNISFNTFGGSTPGGGGTPSTYLGAFSNRIVAIAVSAAATATTSINGNLITNFSTNTTTSVNNINGIFSGIWVSGGNANIGTVSGNTIGSGTGTGTITCNYDASATGSTSANLISYSGTGTVNIANNTIGGINLTSSNAAGGAMGCQAILVASGTPTIVFNTIGSTVTPNSINASTVNTSAAIQRVAGIVVTNGVTTNSTINISGNVIANLTQAASNNTSYVRAISYFGKGATAINSVSISNNAINNLIGGNTNSTLASSTLGVMGILFSSNGFSTTFYSNPTISNNIINTLSDTSTTASQTNVAAIAVDSVASVGIVANNRIYDLRNLSTRTALTTPPTATGILMRTIVSGAASVYNNMISLGSTQTNDAQFMGIWNQRTTGGTLNVFYNSVNIEGTVSSGVLPSFCFIRGDNTTASALVTSLDIKNNIFNNNRTGGTGAHYAIANNYGHPTASSATGWVSNYNVLNAANTTNIGFWSGAQTFANWQTTSVSDANSLSAINVIFTNTTTGDLHILPTSNCSLDGRGTPITITTDFDNQVRDVTTPDVGADEYTSAASNTLYNTVAGTTVTDTKLVTATTIFTSANCERFAVLTPIAGNPVSGSVTARVYKYATVQTYNAEPYLQRVIDITPDDNTATATGRVTLYYTQQEFTDFNTASGPWPDLPIDGADVANNKANLRISKFGGTPNVTPSLPNQYSAGTAQYINPPDADIVWNATDSRWEVTVDVTGFSGFYIHTNSQFVLPITFNYLNGVRQGTNHLLNWKVTCTGSPTATLILERSGDNRTFTSINSITATALRCADPFAYTDANPLIGMNYYRVKFIDAGGKASYGNTIAILNAVKGFEVLNVAPNPVSSNGSFKLNISSAKSEIINVAITDLQGRVVEQKQLNVIAGFNALPMNIGKLASGTYNLQITNNASDKPKVVRLVKQ